MLQIICISVNRVTVQINKNKDTKISSARTDHTLLMDVSPEMRTRKQKSKER